jgi:two-component system, NarL family, nitrate/nitrite response regulator NarL
MHILVVDDHQLLCVALCEHLERLATKLSVGAISVSPMFTLSGAIAALTAEHAPDLVFLDLNLDSQNHGATTLREFQKCNRNNLPVVVFTGLTADDRVGAAILRECLGVLGAKGILLKGTDLDKSFVGLARLLAGELWMPEEVLMMLATTVEPDRQRDINCGLTPTEWRVAQHLVHGLQNKHIAHELRLSEQYVRQLTTQIYRKLDVHNRTQAADRIRRGRLLE